MSLLNRRRVLLAKLESAYGTDATPGNANAILALQSGFVLNPLEGSEVSRDFVRPYFGSAGKIRVENFASLEFEVELAGSGTAGSIPAVSPLLRACGLSETIVGSAITGTAQTGTGTTVVLAASASGIGNFYSGMMVSITSGTGSGQTRTISGYDAVSKTATVSMPWTGDHPISGSGYSIAANVSYLPVSLNQESCTLYFNLDGVRHILIGCMGTMSLALNVKQIPALKFKMTGLLGTITDQTLPQADYSGFKAPLAVSTANTVGFLLHGNSAANLQSLSCDIGNTVIHRMLVGSESVMITNRVAVGNVAIEASPVSSNALHTEMTPYDWWSAAKNKVRGPLSVQHGTAAGNTVTITSPSVEVGTPKYQDMDGIAMLALALDFVPNQTTGNDELKLTFQ